MSRADQLDTFVAQVLILAILHPLPQSFPPLLTKRSIPAGMISNPKNLQVGEEHNLACGSAATWNGVVSRRDWSLLPQDLGFFVAGWLFVAVFIVCHDAFSKRLNISPARIHLGPGRVSLSTHVQVSPLHHLGIPLTFQRHDVQKVDAFILSSQRAKKGKMMPDGRDTPRVTG